MLKALNVELGLALTPSRLLLADRTAVQVDGLDEESKVACEVYARVGRL